MKLTFLLHTKSHVFHRGSVLPTPAHWVGEGVFNCHAEVCQSFISSWFIHYIILNVSIHWWVFLLALLLSLFEQGQAIAQASLLLTILLPPPPAARMTGR